MTYRPFPPRPGAGGGGGSYDDTALRARVAAGETTNATQDGTLRDHAGRLLKIEETPPFDDRPLRKDIGDLGSALAAEARDRAFSDRALAERAETADVAAGRLADRVTGLEGRPAPVPYDDTALSGRVGAVETDVEGLDGRLKTVEGRPATAPYDDAAIRKTISDETNARTAADTAFDERLDDAQTAITAQAGRLKAVEDRPMTAAYDDTGIRGRLTTAEERIGAVDGRVKTLEGRPEHVPYDDTPLRGRLSALEKADGEFDDALDREIDARAEADRQLGVRIDAVSSAGYDDTALTTRIKTLEDRPAPAAFDDAALREADRQLEARIDGLPAPFDPAPLIAADAELGRRIRIVEDRPAAIPFDPKDLIAADSNLNQAIGRVAGDLREIESGFFRKELRPGQSVQGKTFPASLATLSDLGLSSSGDLRIYVLDDLEAVLAVHAITARPADRIADYLASFPAGLRGNRIVVGSDAFVTVEADHGTYPTGRVLIEYGSVSEMLGLYRGPVAALDDRFDAIGGGGGPPYDDAPLTRRVVALEERPIPAAFDPSALEAADRALDDRIDGHDVLFGQVRDGMGAHLERLTTHDRALSDHRSRIIDLEGRPSGSSGSSGGVTRLLGKRRIRVSSGPIHLSSIVPDGTSEFEIVNGGGGASGVAANTSANSPGYGHGGHPGDIRRSGRIAYKPTLTLEASIGAGGARAVRDSSATTPIQNPGSDTVATLRDGSAIITALRAKGGGRWGDQNPNGTFPSSAVSARSDAQMFMEFPPGPTGGIGVTGTHMVQRLTSATDVWNGPSGGGGAVRSALSPVENHGGRGGAVHYDRRPEAPASTGHTGGVGSGNGGIVAGAGQNPTPDEAGTYGSGGGGGRYGTGVTAGTAGGDGGYPSGGGGGAWADQNAAGDWYAGRGGDGFIDIFFYGVAA